MHSMLIMLRLLLRRDLQPNWAELSAKNETPTCIFGVMPRCCRLQRACFTPCCAATDSNETSFCTSTVPTLLNVTLPKSRCVITPPPPPLPTGVLGLIPSLHPGTRLTDGAPGFSTLSTLVMRSELRKASVNVLGSASKKESLVLEVQVSHQSHVSQGPQPHTTAALNRMVQP